MQSDRLGKPKISSTALRWFSRYAGLYLRRNFHALRLASGRMPQQLESYPVVVCMNHPSWWDPLVALMLAGRAFPGRSHYAPMEASALTKYKVFEKIGFFGIEPGTLRGAARFLGIGKAVLSDNSGVLWVTAQGTFVDPRVRPVELRPGIGHLVHGLQHVAVIPLALEYPFWEERYPEALARWGEPVIVHWGPSRSADEWTYTISRHLWEAQDLLAEDAKRRNADAFEVILRGRVGIGGFYDAWRSFKAKLRGQRFRRAHGSEEI